jgi:hypothetical protein
MKVCVYCSRKRENYMFDFDADDFTIPLPRKGDKIFNAGADVLSDVQVQYMSDRWGKCIQGFKLLADIGVEYVLSKQEYEEFLMFSIA